MLATNANLNTRILKTKKSLDEVNGKKNVHSFNFVPSISQNAKKTQIVNEQISVPWYKFLKKKKSTDDKKHISTKKYTEEE